MLLLYVYHLEQLLMNSLSLAVVRVGPENSSEGPLEVHDELAGEDGYDGHDSELLS